MIASHASTSAGAPARSPTNTSGAMYAGVPGTSPVLVSDMSTVPAMPKPITRGPSGPRSTLSGLRNDHTRRAAVVSFANLSRTARSPAACSTLTATRLPSAS
ncbi:hypothetical protein [Nonomuraea rubra]|uniref:hypothetical protein n=1 Tax=Nonomuraea rubra TaxID=46180 RepID=UPI0033FF39AB